jgi:sugar lactone lactonase YvrE
VTVHALPKRLGIGLAVIAIAATAATGASGVSGSDRITTIAGSGSAKSLGDGGPATEAQLFGPEQVAVDAQRNVYIADMQNNRVRKVTPEGTISTFAGTGKLGALGDGGPATSASLYYPSGVAVDAQGNVYIADRNHARVRKVTPDGKISTIAGTGQVGPFKGDGGPATSATLSNPWSVAVDGQGNLYVADTSNQRVRKVSAVGTITTIAGTGTQGFSGDGGPATSARLHNPYGVAVDRQGNVYIADSENHRVRKVSGGTITTIAGTGSRGYSGEGGAATSAQLNWPWRVAVDGQGDVYIADSQNSRVRKVSAGKITTVAGTGKQGYSGDGGPASSAQVGYPNGVAVDGQGSLYITDAWRIRKVSTGSAATLTLTLGGTSSQKLIAQKGITVTAKCNKPCSLSATGSVTIVGTKYVFRLTRASAALAAGKRTLTLRCSAAQLKRFRQFFTPGQQAKAVITVKATDKAGRTRTSKRTVVIR